MATPDQAAGRPEQTSIGAARPPGSTGATVKGLWAWLDDRLGLSAFG